MSSYKKDFKNLPQRYRLLQKKHYRTQQENKALRKENLSLKAMIDCLRKERFGGKKKKKQETEEIRIPKKKGAPFGHKGVTRKKPEIIDEEIRIPDPLCCPDCAGNNITFIEQEQHTQEEIILPKKKFTKYIRNVFKCGSCGKFIRIYGPGEMPKAYIGPQAKAVVNYLR